MPAGVNYMRSSTPRRRRAITGVPSWDLYNGKIYAIAQFDNGDMRHYYDGACRRLEQRRHEAGGFGSIARTHRRKMYSPVGSILWFSALDTAICSTPAAGAGFQNMSTHQSGSDSGDGPRHVQRPAGRVLAPRDSDLVDAGQPGEQRADAVPDGNGHARAAQRHRLRRHRLFLPVRQRHPLAPRAQRPATSPA
jgi:hypothetical protein